MIIQKREDEKILNAYTRLKVKCICGHTQVIPVFLDDKICTNCGRKLKNTTKLHFMYKMRKELRNEKNKN